MGRTHRGWAGVSLGFYRDVSSHYSSLVLTMQSHLVGPENAVEDTLK